MQVTPASSRTARAAGSRNRAIPMTSLSAASANVVGSATWPVGPVTRMRAPESMRRTLPVEQPPDVGRLAGVLETVGEHADDADTCGDRRVPVRVDDAVELRRVDGRAIGDGQRVRRVVVLGE